MTDDTPEQNNAVVTSWFSEPLSDEAAFAIHLFLQQFTYQFESVYYSQIKRHLEEEQTATHTEQDSDTPWDDSIDF